METGKGKLIVGNYLQPVGHGFQFGMADKQIVDIQAEAELIVQQPIKHTCTDAVSGAHQIDALILTGRIGTGQRGQKSLLLAHSMLGVSL